MTKIERRLLLAVAKAVHDHIDTDELRFSEVDNLKELAAAIQVFKDNMIKQLLN